MKSDDTERRQDNLNLLLTMVYKMTFPIWQRYHSAVPHDELKKLEEYGDWPRGLAAAVMSQINRDEKLRKQLYGLYEATHTFAAI